MDSNDSSVQSFDFNQSHEIGSVFSKSNIYDSSVVGYYNKGVSKPLKKVDEEFIRMQKENLNLKLQLYNMRQQLKNNQYENNFGDNSEIFGLSISPPNLKNSEVAIQESSLKDEERDKQVLVYVNASTQVSPSFVTENEKGHHGLRQIDRPNQDAMRLYWSDFNMSNFDSNLFSHLPPTNGDEPISKLIRQEYATYKKACDNIKALLARLKAGPGPSPGPPNISKGSIESGNISELQSSNVEDKYGLSERVDHRLDSVRNEPSRVDYERGECDEDTTLGPELTQYTFSQTFTTKVMSKGSFVKGGGPAGDFEKSLEMPKQAEGLPLDKRFKDNFMKILRVALGLKKHVEAIIKYYQELVGANRTTSLSLHDVTDQSTLDYQFLGSISKQLEEASLILYESLSFAKEFIDPECENALDEVQEVSFACEEYRRFSCIVDAHRDESINLRKVNDGMRAQNEQLKMQLQDAFSDRNILENKVRELQMSNEMVVAHKSLEQKYKAKCAALSRQLETLRVENKLLTEQQVLAGNQVMTENHLFVKIREVDWQQNVAETETLREELEALTKKYDELKRNQAAHTKDETNVVEQTTTHHYVEQQKMRFKYRNMVKENRRLRNKLNALELHAVQCQFNNPQRIPIETNGLSCSEPDSELPSQLEQLSIESTIKPSPSKRKSNTYSSPSASQKNGGSHSKYAPSLTQYTIMSKDNEYSASMPNVEATLNPMQSKNLKPKIRSYSAMSQQHPKEIQDKTDGHSDQYHSLPLQQRTASKPTFQLSAILNFRSQPNFTGDIDLVSSCDRDNSIIILQEDAYQKFARLYERALSCLTVYLDEAQKARPIDEDSDGHQSNLSSFVKALIKADNALYAEYIWKGKFRAIINVLHGDLIKENEKFKKTIQEINEKLNHTQARKKNLERGIMYQLGKSKKVVEKMKLENLEKA